MPRVTIVIPTLDANDHVDECIECLLTQTFESFELIVVDDGSTDGTVDTVRSFDDDRIRLIERNGSGVASARNHGIECSESEYVATHDADDRSAPTRLEEQIDYLDHADSVALVGSGARLIDETGAVHSRRRVLERPSFDDLISQNHFVHGSTLIRREAFERIGGYDESFPLSEDYDLYLRLALHYPIRNIDRPLYEFRIHRGSLYESSLERTRLYHRFAIRRVLNDLPEGSNERIRAGEIDWLYDQLTSEERHELHVEVAKELLRYGRSREAISHSLRAIESRPAAPINYFLGVLSLFPPEIGTYAARAYRPLLNWRLNRTNSRCDK